MRSLLAAAALLALFAAPALADVKVAGIFGDHMVLQRDKPIRIWGTGEPGERVTVKLGGNVASSVTDTEGRWQVELPAMKAGGPHKVTIKGYTTIRLKDVLIGEVWLCSGQSNMEWTVQLSADAKKEISAAKDKKIRHFKVAHRPSGSPLDEITSTWQVCSSDTVARFTACGYYMARELRKRLKVPIGLINSSWGGTRIEPWVPPEGFASVPSLADLHKRVVAADGKKPANHQQASVLYKGMIHALVGLPMRGAIWYQGESNHTEGRLYTEKKKALIQGWRELWGQGEFPFYFVQIAPFQYGQEDPAVLPTFWEAQAAVLDVVPNTGMVVTNDISTLNDIHPPNKQDVGKRLALLALARTYGQNVIDSGPTLAEMRVDEGTLRLVFDNAGKGLRSRDKKPLTHFEIAGADTGFHPAKAKIEGNTIVLSAKEVPAPFAMRFAWHKLAEPNLMNSEGLPASAFRAGEIPKPDFLGEIEEATGYTLAYDIDLANLSATPVYDVDKRGELEGKVARVAFLLELQPDGTGGQYLWVSMDAFTEDAKALGIPTAASGSTFQQAVTGLTVLSNVKGIETGSRLTGNIEFWASNYGPANAANVEGASAQIWDFGDAPGGAADGYGCMQVHNPGAKQTLFAINNWKAGGAGADIGIGSSDLDQRTTDWTFARNGGRYTHKRLRVFVQLK